MTTGGNNFNDFPENQLTKFRAISLSEVGLLFSIFLPEFFVALPGPRISGDPVN